MGAWLCRSANNDADAYTDANNDTDADTDTNSDAVCHSTCRYANPHSRRWDANSYANGYSYAYAHANPYTNGYGYSYAHGSAYTNGNPYSRR